MDTDSNSIKSTVDVEPGVGQTQEAPLRLPKRPVRLVSSVGRGLPYDAEDSDHRRTGSRRHQTPELNIFDTDGVMELLQKSVRKQVTAADEQLKEERLQWHRAEEALKLELRELVGRYDALEREAADRVRAAEERGALQLAEAQKAWSQESEALKARITDLEPVDIGMSEPEDARVAELQQEIAAKDAKIIELEGALREKTMVLERMPDFVEAFLKIDRLVADHIAAELA